MRLSSKIIIKIIVLPFLIFICYHCCPDEWDIIKINLETQKKMANVSAGYLSTIAEYYEKGDYKNHAKYTAGLLKLMNRLPIEMLNSCENVLLSNIEKNGLAPYLTVAIELGYRQSRTPTLNIVSNYRLLSNAVVKHLKKPQIGKSAVLIRSMWNDGYRAYSENVGFAIAGLGFTKLGQGVYAAGGHPEHLLRIFALYMNCNKINSDSQNVEDNIANKNCRLFNQEITNALKDSDLGGLTPSNITDFVNPGIKRDFNTCLSSIVDNSFSEIIEKFEEKVSCIKEQKSQLSSRINISPSGTISSTGDDYTPHSDGPEAIKNLLKDYTLINSREDEVWASSSKVSMQFTYEYVKNDDPESKATISEYSIHLENGTSETGTVVILKDEDGTTTNLYDSDGNLRQVNWEGSDLTSSIFTYDEEGNLKSKVIFDPETEIFTVIEYSDDGTQKETQYDSYRNCLSGCDEPANVSQPVDEYTEFPCNDDIIEQMQSEFKVDLGLGPWILPNPDAEPEPVDDDCLSDFFNNSPNTCPPSVALCIEPAEDCGCAQLQPGSIEYRMGTLACTYINCGSNADCDPKTGTCNDHTNTGDQPYPGIITLPIFNVSVPPIIGVPRNFSKIQVKK
jgi:hypothetical protein